MAIFCGIVGALFLLRGIFMWLDNERDERDGLINFFMGVAFLIVGHVLWT